ncbi:MAG: zinc metalloprotease HtpX [Actinobacteria bacterium]|nr:zinc metalloprotease HtpX [Actinomycetota bacterium]
MLARQLLLQGVSDVIGLNRAKTWILIAALGGLFVLIGFWVGGTGGASVALVLGLAFNFAMYWYSDRIAIATTRSKPVTESEAPELHRIVGELTGQANLPMPRLHVSEMTQPNAFATGRNPQHAAVSVTRGILQILDQRELRAVLAHELSHVANRDILVSSIASAIGMSIVFLSRFALFFGGGSRDRNPFGPFAFLIAWILAPLAAAIIQMAVSRAREYQADESGALLSQDPEGLASALRKLEASVRQVPVPATVSPAQAHMFIVNPFSGRNAARAFGSLFRTHPRTEERIARLEQIGRQLGMRS